MNYTIKTMVKEHRNNLKILCKNIESGMRGDKQQGSNIFFIFCNILKCQDYTRYCILCLCEYYHMLGAGDLAQWLKKTFYFCRGLGFIS